MRYFILSLCAVLLIAPLCSCAGRTAAVSDGSSLPDAVVGTSEDPAAAASGTTVGTVTIVCARDAVSAADELTPTGDRNAVWRMPDLIGRDFALCGTLIARGDVDWTVAELIDDPSVPTYGVIRQDPAPGAQVRYGDRLSLTVSYPRLGGINRLTPGTLVLKKGETAEIGYQILLPEPLTDVVLLPYPAAYDGSIIRLTDTTDRGGGRQTVRLQGLAPGRTTVTLSFRNVTGGPQLTVTTTVTVTE